MIKINIIESILLLHIISATTVALFAVAMVVYYGVPYYIAAIPIMCGIIIYIFNMLLVRDYNTLNPGTDNSKTRQYKTMGYYPRD
tara:strand:+ start:3723 stop:3977 length:255 start_codon:yes stop_codon:yes gene_type:complete